MMRLSPAWRAGAFAAHYQPNFPRTHGGLGALQQVPSLIVAHTILFVLDDSHGPNLTPPCRYALPWSICKCGSRFEKYQGMLRASVIGRTLAAPHQDAQP